jgi:Cu-processing system permease protein
MAVSFSLSLSFLIGTGIPLLIFNAGGNALTLLYSGSMLTFVFVSLAFLASVLTRDKAKAIGIALVFWLYFSLIYDGLVLWIVYAFSNYPLERITVALVALNPVDMARITLLLQLDVSALMGYTGAFYKSIFNGNTGIMFSILALATWIFLPVFWALRIFKTKDL